MIAHYTKQQIKVANVLASFLGMNEKTNPNKAKRHLLKVARKNGIDQQGIIDLIPLARQIVHQKAVYYMNNFPSEVISCN